MRNLKNLKLPEFNHIPRAYTGPSYDQMVKDRYKYMPSFYTHYYKQPLYIVQGKYQYLFDHKGDRYLDLIAGISTVSIGHCHPKITKIIQDQADKLVHTSPIYMGQSQTKYAKALCEQLGPQYDNFFICNSGSQANDLAISLARLFTGQQRFYSLRNAYHGLVGNSRSVTNVNVWNSTNFSNTQNFQKLAWPSAYRTNHQNTQSLINDIQQTFHSGTNGKIAGAIFQPVQGVGGINVFPQGYIKGLTQKVKKYGGLVIVDQVQTGFGRVGKDFWGHRWAGIKPDIITMAKGIGNGLPLAGIIARKQIMDSLKTTFFNTYGGGHIQCQVGYQVLKTLREQNLHLNAEKIGHYLMTEFNKLKQKYPIIGDVRGKGLMMGIQLVKDPKTKEPAAKEAADLMQLTRQRRILLGKGGAYGNVLRIQPPLCLSEADAKYAIQAFEDALISLK